MNGRNWFCDPIPGIGCRIMEVWWQVYVWVNKVIIDSGYVFLQVSS